VSNPPLYAKTTFFFSIVYLIFDAMRSIFYNILCVAQQLRFCG